ncbi:MAG: hypothetical protein K1X71_02425 [Pirellulales bacterium]|nr:hypothetical protein [Pirellulales bacterium]
MTLLIAIMLLAAFPGEPLEVHELESSIANHLDRDLRVTGRFDSYSAGRMRLIDSKVDFRLGPDVAVHRNPQFVELTGKLSQSGGHPAFEVMSLAKIPGETARYAELRKLVQPGDYTLLYELGRWAGDRGRWYQDAALLQLARQTYREAFLWEADSLSKPRSANELLGLIERGAEAGIDPVELLRLKHRALWLKVAATPPNNSSALRALADEVRKTLPQPVAEKTTVPTEEALTRYRQSPEEVYLDTPLAERDQWHRAFYAQLLAQAIELEAALPQADLVGLAREIEERIPEHQAQARALELRAAESRAVQVTKLSRGELLGLREAFNRLGEPARARRLATDWLSAARRRLEPADAEDHIALARDYLSWLDDRTTAIELYKAAFEIADSAEAVRGLESLGLVRLGGVWRQRDEAASGDGVGDSAVVRPGDAEQRVIELLRAPDHISRTAGAGWLFEQWRYAGPPELVVYLRRSTATGRAVVTRVVAP